MRLRIAATLLLLLQLQPLGGLALCLIPDKAPVKCHEMAPHHRMADGTPAVQAQPHCADMGMCGAPSVGTPAFPATALPPLPPFDHSPAVTPLHPGDPIAPPAPPPQA